MKQIQIVFIRHCKKCGYLTGSTTSDYCLKCEVSK